MASYTEFELSCRGAGDLAAYPGLIYNASFTRRYQLLVSNLVGSELTLPLPMCGSVIARLDPLSFSESTLLRSFGGDDARPTDTCFSVSMSIPKAVKQLDKDTGEEWWLELDVPEVLDDINYISPRLGFAMQIAAPGSVSNLSFAGRVGDVGFMKATKIASENFQRASRAVLRHRWPNLDEVLAPSRCWTWLSAQRGFTSGYGGGPTGRALNALSHAAAAADPVIAMFWAMVGLESIYTTSDAGLLSQVRERSQLLLGESKTAARLLTEMYRVRSKLVHGKLDFAGTSPDYVDERDVAVHERDMDNALDVALSCVLATIRELIARNWAEVHFGAHVEGR